MTDTATVISVADDADIEELVQMYTHPELKVTEEEAAWYASCYHSYHRIFVARVDERLKGACTWRIEGERHCGLGWIDNLWVEPDSRMLGLGERLLRAAIDDMVRSYGSFGARLRRVVLTTQVERQDARRLYERMGFRQIARLGDLYDDGIEDLLYVLDVVRDRPQEAASGL